MNMQCSVCGSTEDLLGLVESRCLPGARFISCVDCRGKRMEPRPLVVLGSIYTDSKAAKSAIKNRLYLGEPIMAEEITT